MDIPAGKAIEGTTRPPRLKRWRTGTIALSERWFKSAPYKVHHTRCNNVARRQASTQDARVSACKDGSKGPMSIFRHDRWWRRFALAFADGGAFPTQPARQTATSNEHKTARILFISESPKKTTTHHRRNGKLRASAQKPQCLDFVGTVDIAD